jgi:sugar phosphate isomerase/epimerase
MNLGFSSLAAASDAFFPEIDGYRGLEMLARYGFTHVELSEQTQPSYLTASAQELERFRRHADGLGMTLWSAHSPCISTNLSAPDEQERQRSLDVHFRALEGLAALGVPYFVVHQVGNEEDSKAEKLRRGMGSVMRLRHEARKVGITLLIENFPYFGPTDLNDFLLMADPEGLGIVIDIGHEWLAGRDPAQAIIDCVEHLRSIHLHDNYGLEGGDDHLPVGHGTLDWAPVFAALDAVAYDGPLMLEVLPITDPLKDMPAEDLVRLCRETLLGVLTGAEA